MSKQNGITVKIDFDKGIDLWNENNPEKEKTSRSDIYENEGITKATLQNWKNGKVPSGIISLINYLDRTRLKLSDIMTATKEKDGQETEIEF